MRHNSDLHTTCDTGGRYLSPLDHLILVPLDRSWFTRNNKKISDILRRGKNIL
jgi:hypothetical protein